MQHTFESLQGVFEPCPNDMHAESGTQQAGTQQGRLVVGAGAVGAGVHMTPAMSVETTKRKADESILMASRRLRKKCRSPSLSNHDDNRDPTYTPSSTGTSSLDEDSGSSDASDSGSSSDVDDSSSGGSSSSESSSGSEEGGSRKQRGSSSSRRPRPAAADPKSFSPARCFLCDYCTSQEVRFVSTFIADNIANMEVSP